MKRRMPIAVRIGASLCLTVAVIVGGMAIGLSVRLGTSVEERIKADNLQIVRARADQVSEIVEKLRWELTTLALQEGLVKGTKQGIPAFMARLDGKLSAEIAVLYFAWPDGSDVTSSGSWSSLAERDYFKAIMSGGQDFAIGAPVISKSLGIPVIPIAVAVKDEGGRTVGLVGLSMKLDKFTEIIGKLSVGRTGYGWAIDGTGLLIAHPSADIVMKLNVTEADEKYGYKGLSALGKDMLALDSGSGAFLNAKGGEMVSFYSRIPGSPGWAIGINMEKAEFAATTRDMIRVMAFASAVALAIAIILSLFLSKSLVRPIKELVKGFEELSAGEADLTKSLAIARNDEVGDLSRDFNAFLSSLRTLVLQLKEVQEELRQTGVELSENAAAAASEVALVSRKAVSVSEKTHAQAESSINSSSAVEEIARNIESLEELIADQAASVTEASASIEQMVGNIASVTTSIDRIAEAFEALSAAAEEGRANLETSGASISQIAERSEALLEANEAISGIASQTNLLAMNAAIEAAHAGEAGKGFSVVADEIRKLSENAADQSRSIGAELTKVLDSIKVSVTSSRQSEESFARVQERIASTDSLVRQVSQAMAEQKEGSAQVLEALRAMNEITSNVRHGSTEMNAGNETILSGMEQLRNASTEIEARMGEMAAGMDAIAASAGKVSGLAEGTKGMIARMDDSIGRFKV